MSNHEESCTKSQCLEKLCDLVDRLSSLPVEVRYNIMERLPMHVAASLGSVSLTWYDTWLSTPVLRFDKQFYSHLVVKKSYQHEQCYLLLLGILVRRRGSLNRVVLTAPHDTRPVLTHLCHKKIKELELLNSFPPQPLSVALFSCSLLERLILFGWKLSIPVRWGRFMNMTYLSLRNMELTGKPFSDLLLSCPKLEEVVLDGCKVVEESFHILECRSLKKLQICGSLVKIVAACSCESLTSLALVDVKSEDPLICKGVCTFLDSCPRLEELQVTFSSEEDLEHQVVFANSNRSLPRLRSIRMSSTMGFSIELRLIEVLLSISTVLDCLHVVPRNNITSDLESRLRQRLTRCRKASAGVMVDCSEPNSN